YSNQLAYSSFWPSPYPATSGAVTLKGGIDNGYVDSNYNYFYDWNITEVCSSARVAVTATVETTDCNLSNPTISDNLIKAVVYPNPYRNTFSIDIDTNDASDVSVKVYDMLGRIIESKDVN